MPFFRRKSAVPAIFREFRLQKSVLLTIEPWLMLGIVINNVFCVKKQRNKRKKCDENLQKTAISGIFQAFSAGKKFSQKSDSFLSIAYTHLCAKNQKKLMKESGENVKKPGFPTYFRYFRPKKKISRKPGSATF